MCDLEYALRLSTQHVSQLCWIQGLPLSDLDSLLSLNPFELWLFSLAELWLIEQSAVCDLEFPQCYLPFSAAVF